jgi:hypothetical protein
MPPTRNSLPVPVSLWISTLASVGASVSISVSTSRCSELSPRDLLWYSRRLSFLDLRVSVVCLSRKFCTTNFRDRQRLKRTWALRSLNVRELSQQGKLFPTNALWSWIVFVPDRSSVSSVSLKSRSRPVARNKCEARVQFFSRQHDRPLNKILLDEEVLKSRAQPLE